MFALIFAVLLASAPVPAPIDQATFNGLLLGGVATLLGLIATSLSILAFFRRQPATSEQLATLQAFQSTITEQLEGIKERLAEGEEQYVRRHELATAREQFSNELKRLSDVERATQDKIDKLTETVARGFQDLQRDIGRIEGQIERLEGGGRG